MSKSSIFRPSKLTDVADQIWKKAELPKPESNESSKPLVLGLWEGIPASKKLPDVPSTSGEKTDVDSFVFGQNIEERAVIPAGKSDSSEAENVKENETKSEPKAEVNKTDQCEPVKMVTGEEGENTVFHANCKLFQLDKEKNKWSERGRGTLKINDKGSLHRSADKFETRIVMRTQGSLRVILNSKIWSEMKLTRVSDKSLSISAFDCDTGGLVAYLITATVKESEAMESCVQDRIARLKSVEDSNGEKKKNETSSIEVSPAKRKIVEEVNVAETDGKRQKTGEDADKLTSE